MRELKIEEKLTSAELSSLLRAIADAIDSGDNSKLSEFGINLLDSDRLKLALKKEGVHVSMRLKIKSAAAMAKKSAGAANAAGKEKTVEKSPGKRPYYKSLKKRLKKSFSAINSSLRNKTLPERTVLKSFLDDADLITTYAGYGDENYPSFSRACSLLRTACESEDLEGATKQFQSVSAVMRDCHKRYKK